MTELHTFISFFTIIAHAIMCYQECYCLTSFLGIIAAGLGRMYISHTANQRSLLIGWLVNLPPPCLHLTLDLSRNQCHNMGVVRYGVGHTNPPRCNICKVNTTSFLMAYASIEIEDAGETIEVFSPRVV